MDDVEMLLFDVEEFGANLPDSADLAELNALARDHDLTYTVHLPLAASFGDAVSMDTTRRAIDATQGLSPFGWVLHLDGRALVDLPGVQVITRWQADAEKVLEQIVNWTGDATRVCVENLEGWEPLYFRDIVARVNASRCVDVGHLWLQHRDPLPHLLENLSRTRVIHLHGIGSRDHQSLRHMPPEQVRAVVDTLCREDYRGVLTLEVFSADDLFSSIAVVEEALSDG